MTNLNFILDFLNKKNWSGGEKYPVFPPASSSSCELSEMLMAI